MKLRIPNPCSANWEHMSEADKGRFCSMCKKNVVDFTIMKPQEIRTHLLEKQDENVCGRFKNNQLSDYKTPLRYTINKIVNMMGVTSILFLWSVNVNAQDYDHVIKEDSLDGENELIEDVTTGEEEFVLGYVKTDIEETERDYLHYYEVDIKPEFSCGGIDSLPYYLGQEVQIPSHYTDRKALDKIFVEFIIDENGFIADVKIIKGNHDDVNKEVVKGLLRMPQWTPGIHNKNTVKVKCLLPIRFQ